MQRSGGRNAFGTLKNDLSFLICKLRGLVKTTSKDPVFPNPELLPMIRASCLAGCGMLSNLLISLILSLLP